MQWFHSHTQVDTNPRSTLRIEPTNPVVRDFSKFWEIRFLSTYFFVPPMLLAIAMYAIGGLPWLVWGFCLPTVTLALP